MLTSQHILEVYGEELDSPYLVAENDGRGSEIWGYVLGRRVFDQQNYSQFVPYKVILVSQLVS
jgi:hypothetical protein